MKISEKIREKRIELGWSQERIREITGQPIARISEIENGKRNPGILTINRVLKALGLKQLDY